MPQHAYIIAKTGGKMFWHQICKYLENERWITIYILIILFSLLISLTAEASVFQADRLSHEISDLLPRDANWYLVVADQKSGKDIISAGNTTGLLLPASLVKLITAGAALERDAEGKHVTMNTEILHEGRIADGIVNGNIVLRGSGNCFLSAADLRQAAKMLQDKGIMMVTGDVVADTANFYTHGLERTRKGAGHSPVSALGLDLHTVSLTVIPGESGKPPIVTVEPPNALVRFAVSARTIAGGKSTVRVTQNDDNSFQMSGEIPHDSVPLHWRVPVADPAGYAARSFRTILAQVGIQIMGKTEKGIAPPGATTLATIPGPAIERIVAEMNVNSLNIAADNLLLALGALDDGLPGTREKGLKVIQNHLSRHGVLSEDVRIVDGSGLLPGNRIAPKTLARYLVAVAKTPWFPALYQSLPRAGIDGTLRGGSFRNERFRAKSGSLENVAALAGYGIDKTGRELAFAFIVNTPGPLPPNARTAGDSIMQFLADEVLQ